MVRRQVFVRGKRVSDVGRKDSSKDFDTRKRPGSTSRSTNVSEGDSDPRGSGALVSGASSTAIALKQAGFQPTVSGGAFLTGDVQAIRAELGLSPGSSISAREIREAQAARVTTQTVTQEETPAQPPPKEKTLVPRVTRVEDIRVRVGDREFIVTQGGEPFVGPPTREEQIIREAGREQRPDTPRRDLVEQTSTVNKKFRLVKPKSDKKIESTDDVGVRDEDTLLNQNILVSAAGRTKDKLDPTREFITEKAKKEDATFLDKLGSVSTNVVSGGLDEIEKNPQGLALTTATFGLGTVAFTGARFLLGRTAAAQIGSKIPGFLKTTGKLGIGGATVGIPTVEVISTPGGIAEKSFRAGQIGTSIAAAGVGVVGGVKVTEKVTDLARTRGLTKLVTEEVVAPEALSGKQTFPTIKRGQSAGSLQKEFQVNRLPDETAGGGFTASGEPFRTGADATGKIARGGSTITTQPGSSEVPGLFQAPQLSPRFLRIIDDSTQTISFGLPKVGEPTAARITPTAFNLGPGVRSTTTNPGSVNVDRSRRFFEQQAASEVKTGKSTLPFIKTEKESVIAAGTNIKFGQSRFFFELKGRKIPILEGTTVPGGVKTRGAGRGGRSSSSNLRPQPRTGIVNPVSSSAARSSRISIAGLRSSFRSSQRASSNRNISALRTVPSSVTRSSIKKSSATGFSSGSFRGSSITSTGGGFSRSGASSSSKRSSIRSLVPLDPPPTIIPNFKPKFNTEKNQLTKGKVRKVKPFFTPSLLAREFGITASAIPKGKFTGFEIRPIVLNRKTKL